MMFMSRHGGRRVLRVFAVAAAVAVAAGVVTLALRAEAAPRETGTPETGETGTHTHLPANE